MSGQTLECPSANTPGRASIFVLFRKTVDAPADALVACDLRGNHAGGRNVLHLDGSVIWYDEADFQSALANPDNAAFAAALRAKEGP